MENLKHSEKYKGYLIEIFEVNNKITYPFQIKIDGEDYYFSPSISNAIELAKEFIQSNVNRDKFASRTRW